MTVEYKRLVMAGPLRWVVLSEGGQVTTFAFLVKVQYTEKGRGNVLFLRSDLVGDGEDDVFAIFSDNPVVAQYLRDVVFNYTVFAGPPGEGPPAPIVGATFESVGQVPLDTVERMEAEDRTTFTLALLEFDPPVAYTRVVKRGMMEVGALSRPSRFLLEINGVRPIGEPGVGPLAEAPPIGGDVQNLWYLSETAEAAASA
jgi:hypothetical protein